MVTAREAAIAQLQAMLTPRAPVLASRKIPPQPGGYGPGTIPGGPRPGTPPRPVLGTFAAQDRAMLAKLQKQYKSEGDVTVVEGPHGYQFSIPGAELIDTPSTFQAKNKGTMSYRGPQHPIINLPVYGPTVL